MALLASDGTISVADFLEQLKEDSAPNSENNNGKQRNGVASGSSRKHGGSSSNRTNSSSSTDNNTITTPPPLSPRPLGSPPAAGAFLITTHITTTYVKDLHELIARITPANSPKLLVATFDIQFKVDADGSPLSTFWGKLTVSGVEGLEGEWIDEGPWASKRLAKEAVARKGEEWLREMVKGWGRQGGKMGGGGKGGVLAASDGQASVVVVQGDEESNLLKEEWVGKLHKYMQMNRFNMPTYTYYSTLTGAAFSCTLTIPELTGHEVSTPLPNPNPTCFGNVSTFYRKKTTARAAAARDAVLWIWSVDPAAKDAALPPASRSQHPHSSLTSSSASGVVEIHIPQELSDARAPQLVGWLCPKLGLSGCEYVFEHPAGVPTLVDAWCRITRVKAGLGVDQTVLIGPVRNIHGKPTAKVKVAELCLYWMCRRESARIGVKIVGLRSEFYEGSEQEEEEEGEEGGKEGEAEEEERGEVDKVRGVRGGMGGMEGVRGAGGQVVDERSAGKGKHREGAGAGTGVKVLGGGRRREEEEDDDDDVMSLA